MIGVKNYIKGGNFLDSLKPSISVETYIYKSVTLMVL